MKLSVSFRLLDQIVARPLLTAPGDCEDGEVGGMNSFLAGETEVLGENLHRCFGLYRYILTQGTPSRSLAHSSWDTLYLRVVYI
jgi:hypothetical protein